MDDPKTQDGGRKHRGKNAPKPLERQRRRTEELLAAQRGRLNEVSAELVAERDRLTTVAADTAAVAAASLHEAAERLTRREASCQELERRLAREREQLELSREQTKTQRRRIARGLQAERAAQQRELEKLHRDIELLEVSQKNHFAQTASKLQQDREQHHQQLEAQKLELRSREEEMAAARRRLAEEQRALDEQQSAVAEEFRREIERLKNDLADAKKLATAAELELTDLRRSAEGWMQERARLMESAALATCALDELRADREALVGRIADAEMQASRADPNRLTELQRRFETVVEDARNLKRRNSELEEEVMGLRAGGARPAAATSSGANPDWESMKQRMLANLETETTSGKKGADETLTIENTILITDDIVAHKDHEIAELKLLLSHQSSNLGSVAVGAAGVVAALETDELIKQERQRLAQMEEQWRTKIRQAEIDISVARAKLARDRAEVEEKLHELTAQQGQSRNSETAPPSNDTAEKPQRGRWLTRLGLKE